MTDQTQTLAEIEERIADLEIAAERQGQLIRDLHEAVVCDE